MKPLLKTFQSRLYMMFVVSIIIPVLIVAGGLSWYYNELIEERNHRDVSNTLTALAGNIQTHFSEIERISFAPYLYKDIYTTLTYFRNGFFIDTPSFINLPPYESTYVLSYAKMMFTTTQNIRGITFYPMGTEEDYVYSLRHNTAGLKITQQPGYEEEDWFKTAQEYTGRYHMLYGAYDNGSRTQEGIILVRVIKDLDAKKDIGVMRIDASADRIFSLLEDIELGSGNQLALVDEQGNILYHKGDAPMEQLAQLPLVNGKNNEYLIVETPLDNSGWHLVHLTSKQTLWLSQSFTFGLALLICAFVILVALLIYRRESKITITSVNEILATLKQIQKGNFAAQAKVTSVTELGTIAGVVNQMGAKINNHIEREYRAVINQQNAEFRALQAQINPHFLYNVLNDFVGLNRMEEREVLEKSIIQLTQMFRYSCTPGDVATLEEEVDFCERYLLLRKLQMEERLEFETRLDEATLCLSIPKLILQPLVENSLIHGMGQDIDVLHITIESRYSPNGQYLLLRVQDDGVGLSVASQHQPASRVGLTNVGERLKNLAPESKLVVYGRPRHGTTCILRIRQTDS